jgi:hypothetical protein
MTTNFNKRLRVLGAVAAAAISLASAAAHAVEATAEQRRACTPDAFRLCSSHIPNVEAITACMRTNKAKLSPECKLVFDKPGPTIAARDTANRERDRYNRDQ